MISGWACKPANSDAHHQGCIISDESDVGVALVLWKLKELATDAFPRLVDAFETSAWSSSSAKNVLSGSQRDYRGSRGDLPKGVVRKAQRAEEDQKGPPGLCTEGHSNCMLRTFIHVLCDILRDRELMRVVSSGRCPGDLFARSPHLCSARPWRNSLFRSRLHLAMTRTKQQPPSRW